MPTNCSTSTRPPERCPRPDSSLESVISGLPENISSQCECNLLQVVAGVVHDGNLQSYGSWKDFNGAGSFRRPRLTEVSASLTRCRRSHQHFLPVIFLPSSRPCS